MTCRCNELWYEGETRHECTLESGHAGPAHECVCGMDFIERGKTQ